MSADTDVLIIGAGMSGIGLAVQMIRKLGSRNFEIVEKTDDVGGTWAVNTYPGCGCDVASHFYSYSFALKPDWTRKFSMRDEIQRYFRDVAEQYDVIRGIRFNSTVEEARWDDKSMVWAVQVKDVKTNRIQERRAKVLVSGVGSLSVPKECEIPGAQGFQGPLFHSANWDHSFDWKDKDVVVLGNGCSATQFVPVMTEGPGAVRKLTQFSRQAQYLAERPNPVYSPAFKAFMRYMPFAMRLYRAKVYADMENDFAGFRVEEGRGIREDLVKTNTEYIKKTAPERYWDALIPKTEIGCKRKVMDTDYLASLHRPNVELISDDPVEEITATAVRTRSGREIRADAIALATGFATHQMLFPMKIYGEKGISLNEHWEKSTKGSAQAYFGTCVSNFPNFFILMGPNTVTGHLSVIYTVECQINFTLRVIEPVLQSSRSSKLSLSAPPRADCVQVSYEAALEDSAWTQREAKKLVWSSGCVNWSLDPSTGMNIMMYPDWQFWYWLRSVFWKKDDFVYREKGGKQVKIPSRLPLWIRTLTLAAGFGGLGLLMDSTMTGGKGVREIKALGMTVADHARTVLQR